MKKIITTVLFFFVLTVQSQTIIPIEDFGYYETNPWPAGDIYVKDINHVLDKYVGTWQGSFDNKTMTIFATKEIQTTDYSDMIFMADRIMMRYIIRDATTNAILVDTTNELSDSPYTIDGHHFASNGWYNLSYAGFADCGQQGELYITTYNNDLNMKMVYAIDDLLLDGESCPNGRSADILRVTETMYFTKQ